MVLNYSSQILVMKHFPPKCLIAKCLKCCHICKCRVISYWRHQLIFPFYCCSINYVTRFIQMITTIVFLRNAVPLLKSHGFNGSKTIKFALSVERRLFHRFFTNYLTNGPFKWVTLTKFV